MSLRINESSAAMSFGRVTYDPPIRVKGNDVIKFPTTTFTLGPNGALSVQHSSRYVWVRHRRWGFIFWWTKHRIVQEPSNVSVGHGNTGLTP